MEKKTAKIILRLVLIIMILIFCIAALSAFFVAAWLQTYKVFTQKTLVAELDVTAQRQEGDKKAFSVTYKEVKARSSLAAIFGSTNSDLQFSDPQTFEMQGDEVRLGGQVVKLNDLLNLFGFKTIYKVTRLESTYLDVAEAKAKPTSIYELNGGVDALFKFYQTNEGALSFIIDTAMGDYPGKNVQNQPVKYGLYVTEEGFLLDRM
jgi:hypothetical protein